MQSKLLSSRRRFLSSATGLSVAMMAKPGLFAEELFQTPRLTEGPFYPDQLPLDQDNDLIIINKNLTPAIGSITHLSGRILSKNGSPMRGMTMEIWQCDANAVYLHSADSAGKKSQQDSNFQGFGRFETSSSGEYRFRTIKPVPYPGRPAPHIHIKVKAGDNELLTTQLMVRGHEGNRNDGVFASAGDFVDRELIQADFKPLEGSSIGELVCNFDIILGVTPDDRDFVPVKTR